MIDTIILRLHNLIKYDLLLKRLEIKNNPGYTSEIAKIDDEEVRKLRGMGYKSPKQIIDILKIRKTGEFLVKTQMGKQMNASNHYAFTYFVNWTKDYIEFNFSVPKYKFGSNVLMFVKHNIDPKFGYSFCSTLEYNITKAPGMIISFINQFLKNEFILENIDLKDLEVNRIDVCFNQMFSSKEDALRYLEYQKRLKKKYAQEEEGVMREYATSLMYVTKRYSAKIYHKGSEYKANDLKEHLKINKAKDKEYLQTEKFQKFSDRMLRYELTIRNSYLNYLFKHNLFRKDCPHFKIDYKSYLRVANAMQKNERISKKVGSFEGLAKELFQKANPYEKIDKNDRLTYKYVSKMLESKTFFMLEVGERTELFNTKKVDYTRDRARFSKEIIDLCLKRLLDFINEFQIKELPDEDKVIAMIDMKNKFGKTRLPKSEMIHFYSLLQKYGSFKEAAKYSHMHRATIYRYKSRFKEIGISETAIKPLDNYSLPIAHIDFKDYHSILMMEYSLLRGIRIN